MLCRSPFIKEGMPFPCGQCMPCRLQRRRHWTHRILLEASEHKQNAFVTLTYDDEHLPRLSDGRGTLNPRDLQLFLKRFRKAIDPVKIRYFVVGEYGKYPKERPHYHMVIFGYPACWKMMGSMFKNGKCCPQCETIANAWQQGFIVSKGVGVASATYVAGYTTKKMTAADDARLKGRFPEFARMSLKPYGIGAGAMYEVASTLLGHSLDKKLIDVPHTLRHGTKEWPLAPYLRRKLRTLIGRDPGAPDEVLEKVLEELLPVQEEAQAMARNYYPNDVQAYGKIYKALIVSKGESKVQAMEGREKTFRKREKL